MENVKGQSRVEVVDAIRGIAVAMILMLHSIEHFNLYNQVDPDSPLLKLVDLMVWDGLWFVIGGKAYAIFALLFGFSFYIMDRNAARRGEDFRLRFCWRMLMLFGFGCLNASFFCGEVLVLYSIVGLVLPMVCRLKTRTLLVVAAVLMAQPVEWMKLVYAAIVDGEREILVFDFREYWNASIKMLAEGGFLETVKTNLWEGQLFSLAWAWGAGRFCQTASLFMLGLAAGRMEWFADSESNRRRWGRVLAMALVAFFPLYGLANMLPRFIENPNLLTPLSMILSSLYKLAFMLVLVSGVLFAYYSTRLQHLLQKLAPYGRMSLTNYITQSIIGAMLYYHWGFALHRYLCTTYCWLVGIAIFLLQLAFCTWWMKHHNHGPLEYLWKRATWLK